MPTPPPARGSRRSADAGRGARPTGERAGGRTKRAGEGRPARSGQRADTGGAGGRGRRTSDAGGTDRRRGERAAPAAGSGRATGRTRSSARRDPDAGRAEGRPRRDAARAESRAGRGAPARSGATDKRSDRAPRSGAARTGDGGPPKVRGWGGVARRGAAQLGNPGSGSASAARRGAVRAARAGDRSDRAPSWEPEAWVDEGPVRAEAERAVARSAPPAPSRPRRARPAPKPDGGEAAPPRPRRRVPATVGRELSAEAGPARAPRLEERLAEAARAFERERYRDARRVLRQLVDEAPAAPAVRELHGLVLYRLGRWAEAIRELETFHRLTGSVEQHPVLADAYRARGRHRRVGELWDELRAVSPAAELVAEGRIVTAGSMADQGDVRGAVRLLEQAPTASRRPRDHHLRVWYALADLYERAGEVPKARELFRRVARHDSQFADVAERLAALG